MRLIPLDAAAAPERGAAAAVEASGVPFLAALTADQRRHLDAAAAATCHLAIDGDDEVVAVVRAVALRWDGRPADAPSGGAREALARAGEPDADTLTVLDLMVAPQRRGTGVGTGLLRQLGALAHEAGLSRTLVLLRPHAKAAHPLTPFVRYLHATGDDPTTPFDGWLRAAWRAGLRPVAAVDRSLVASAPLAAWSAWCRRRFPTSGPELVPGAIKPVVIEFERGEGRYREPHLWAAPSEDLADEVARPDAWGDALAAVDIVAGDRAHREVKRRR